MAFGEGKGVYCPHRRPDANLSKRKLCESKSISHRRIETSSNDITLRTCYLQRFWSRTDSLRTVLIASLENDFIASKFIDLQPLFKLLELMDAIHLFPLFVCFNLLISQTLQPPKLRRYDRIILHLHEHCFRFQPMANMCLNFTVKWTICFSIVEADHLLVQLSNPRGKTSAKAELIVGEPPGDQAQNDLTNHIDDRRVNLHSFDLSLKKESGDDVNCKVMRTVIFQEEKRRRVRG